MQRVKCLVQVLNAMSPVNLFIEEYYDHALDILMASDSVMKLPMGCFQHSQKT